MAAPLIIPVVSLFLVAVDVSNRILNGFDTAGIFVIDVDAEFFAETVDQEELIH